MRIAYSIPFLLLGSLLGLWSSCSDKEDIKPFHEVPVNKTDARDSVLFISRQFYLWNTNIPSSLKGSDYSDPFMVINAIRNYSPINPMTGKHIDKWSYVLSAEQNSNNSRISSTEIGLSYRFNTTTDLRVREVELNSPAEKAGIKRGWQVLKINNIECKSDNINALNAALTGSSINYVFSYTADGKTQTKEMTLTAGSYSSPTVSNVKVIDQGGKKVGYLKFSTFYGSAIQELDIAFAIFRNSNVQAVVIDLRYNGGGLVSIAEHLSNLLAPAKAKEKVMYSSTHNKKLSYLNSTTHFNVSPVTLPTLEQVAILTTSSTASASEIVINVLQPYWGNKLAIIGSTTHGKPFGMYSLPIMRKTAKGPGEYYAAPIATTNVNAAGVGDYINGIAPTINAMDDLTKDFGDIQEASLKTALNWIGSGQIATVPASHLRLSEQLEPANRLLDTEFKGMFHELPR